MEAFAHDVEQEQEISKRQELEKEELHSRLSSLDAALRADEADCSTDEVVDIVADTVFEKRKDRARRVEEKERKRLERRLRKKQRGVRHGRLGK